MGIRREGKKTFAGPNVTNSTMPEILMISRYLATELRLSFIFLEMSVTVMPLGLARSIS